MWHVLPGHSLRFIHLCLQQQWSDATAYCNNGLLGMCGCRRSAGCVHLDHPGGRCSLVPVRLPRPCLAGVHARCFFALVYYVSCRVQYVCATNLLLMQTSHLFCLRRSSSLACRCTMGLARALGQRCGSRPQMLPKGMVLARCSAVFSV